MKGEYWLATVVGLVILAYVLDSVVNPLTLSFPTPYHFFTIDLFKTYPFTSVSIFIKAVALFITPIIALSLFGGNKLLKGIILLILSGLFQLYALQDVASGAHTIPLEWAIAITLSGMALLLLSVIFVIIGLIDRAGNLGLDSTDDFKL